MPFGKPRILWCNAILSFTLIPYLTHPCRLRCFCTAFFFACMLPSSSLSLFSLLSFLHSIAVILASCFFSSLCFHSDLCYHIIVVLRYHTVLCYHTVLFSLTLSSPCPPSYALLSPPPCPLTHADQAAEARWHQRGAEKATRDSETES